MTERRAHSPKHNTDIVETEEEVIIIRKRDTKKGTKTTSYAYKKDKGMDKK